MTEDEETKQLFEEAAMLLSDLRQSVATPADAMFVLCIAMFLLDVEYRKPGATSEDCVRLIEHSFHEIEMSHVTRQN